MTTSFTDPDDYAESNGSAKSELTVIGRGHFCKTHPDRFASAGDASLRHRREPSSR